MTRLAGKTAIITGAAGDIGKAALRRFVEEGARVLAIDIDEGELTNVLNGFKENDASGIVADVTKSDDMARAVDAAISRFGHLDIALLNAGIEGQVAPITDYEEDVFDRVIAVNVRGVWLGLKHVMRVMRPAGAGSIVLTSSVAGVRGLRGISAYTASKHAVVGFDAHSGVGGCGIRRAGQYRQSGTDRVAHDPIACIALRAGRSEWRAKPPHGGHTDRKIRHPGRGRQHDVVPRQ